MSHPRVSGAALVLGLLVALWARPADAIVAGTRPAKFKTFRVYGNGLPIGNTLMGTDFFAPQVNTHLLPSSTATLSGVPPDGEIQAAYLFWAGSYSNGFYAGPFSPDTVVTFKVVDGASIAVAADECKEIAIFEGFYRCRADVSDIVKAHPGGARFNGDYTVSDVDADPGHIDIMAPPNCESTDPTCQAKFASWTMIVVYSSPTAPLQRDVHIYDGFESFDETGGPFTSGIDSFGIDGFLVGSPPVGEIAYWGMEGDALLGVPPQDTDPFIPCDTCFDFFQYNATKLQDVGTNNNAGNLFNSSTALGLDIDTFKIGSQAGGMGLLSVGDTAATLTVGSGDDLPGPPGGSGGGEFVVLGWTLLRLNRPSPQFQNADTFKTVDPLSAGPGETVFYTVQVANEGSADATGASLTDVLPPTMVYVAGSARLDGTPCSDAADGDGCTFSGGTLSATLGTIPSMPPGDKRILTFRARVAAGVPDGTAICNSASLSFAEATEAVIVGPACLTTSAAAIGTPTKQMNDLNGGLVQPDDLLQFSISIPASRATSGVAFEDDMPKHLHLVSVTSPAGSTDSSSPSGGANGTGRVAIDNITIPSDTTPASFSFIARVSSLGEWAADGIPPGGIDGQAVCNQGQVTLPTPAKNTDDPATGAADDPTCGTVRYTPGFSSSKKTVADLNGGKAVPGDVIEYQIDIINSGSTGATVNVSDPMPPGVTGFVPITLPPGSTFFPPPAGANGTGLLTITGLGVAAGATVSARFQLTIDAAAADGLVIQNAADMTVVMFPAEDRTLTSPPLTVFSRPDVSSTTKTVEDLNGGDVQPNDILRWTITIPNEGNKPALGVAVVDVVDANLLDVTPLDGGSFDAGTRTITWSLGDIPPFTTPGVVVRFEARIKIPLPDLTEIANQAFVTGSNIPREPSDDPGSAAPDDATRVVVISKPDFRNTSKTVEDLNGAPVEPGDVLRYTIVVGNQGTAIATDTTVNDAVDPSLTDVVPGSGGSFFGGIVTWSVGTLAPGETATVTFDATVKTPLLNGTAIANQAFVRSTEKPAAPGTPSDDPGTAAPGDPTVVTVVSRADLTTSTKIGDDENRGAPQPGDVFTYEIHVKDTGNSPASGVVVTDTLEANLTFIEALDGGVWDAGTRTITWTVPGLVDPGTDAIVRFRASIATPLADGTLVCNQATLTSPEATGPAVTDDPSTGAASDPTCVSVISKPELVASTKAAADDNGGAPEPGDGLTYTILASNTGNVGETGVVVTDVVPVELGDVVALDGGSYDGSTRTITWTVGDLAAKESKALRFTAKIVRPLDSGTPISNQAQLASNELGGGFVTDDPATAAFGDPTVVKVVSAPRFSTSTKDVLDVNGGKLEPGDKLTYTITVVNDGGSLARNVVVTDVVPKTLTAVVPADGGTFDAGSRTITWTSAGNAALATVGMDAAKAVTLTFGAQVVEPLDNSTVICNQGEIKSDEQSTPTPTDDPRTPTPLDATCGTVFSAADFSNAAKTVVDENGAPFRPGDLVTYTVSFTNTGNTKATDVVVVDPIDASLEAVTPAKGGVFTSGPPAQIRWDSSTTPELASVPVAATVTLTFTARARKPLDNGTVIANQATITATGVPDTVTDDPTTAPRGDATRLTIVSAVDLTTFAKTALDENGPPLRPGDGVMYTLRVSNTGDALAKDITVTDVVDVNLTGIVPMDGGVFDSATRTITWTVPVVGLSPGGDVLLRFHAGVKTPLANGTAILNQGRLSGAGVTVPLLSDDPATPAKDDPTKLVVVSAPNFTTSTKTVSGDVGGFAGPGVTLNYSIKVANSGDDTGHGVVLTDRVDDVLEAVTPLDGGVFDLATRVITWTLGDVSPGDRTVRFSARVKADAKNGYVIKNQGFIASAAGGPPVPTDDPRNGLGDDNPTNVTVNAVPRLAITKEFTDVNGGKPAPGDPVKYTLTVTNVGAAYAYDASIDDPIDQTNLIMIRPGQGGLLGPAGIRWNSATTAALGVIAPAGKVVLEVDAVIRPGTPNGAVISNQATLRVDVTAPVLSDDPLTPAPNDPTRFTVVSIADLAGSPKAVQDVNGGQVLPGDDLVYTIKVTNAGTDVAHGVQLVDPIPGSATLVPGTVTLNGATQPDASLGMGMTVQTPGAPAGDLRPGPTNAATVVFRVKVLLTATAGTIVSNQGLLFATGLAPAVTDDPRTVEKGDPTQVVVGGGPILRNVTKTYEPKPVGGNGDGNFDPGEEIDYRVSISNTGDAAAHGVVFKDLLPVNTAYVAGTLRLGDATLSDPVDADAGEVVGRAITVRIGTLPAGARAEVEFRARIVSGTEVVNQGDVRSQDTPPEKTDADGNDGNGNQPTVTPVGRGRPTFGVSKAAYDLNGGTVQGGDVLLYVVTVTNNSPSDQLDVDAFDSIPDLTSYVDRSATAAATTIRLDPPPAGVGRGRLNVGAIRIASKAQSTITFRVQVDKDVACGRSICNVAEVKSMMMDITPTLSAPACVLTCSAPGTGGLGGVVFEDVGKRDHKLQSPGDLVLPDFVVQAYPVSQAQKDPISTSVSAADGRYQMLGLPPGPYLLRVMSSKGAQYAQFLTTDLGAGMLPTQDLPVDPSGRVYDSGSGKLLGDARALLYYAAADPEMPGQLVPEARLPIGQQGQRTTSLGMYHFDVEARHKYRLAIEPPGLSHSFPSTIPGMTPTAGFAEIDADGNVVPNEVPDPKKPNVKLTYYLQFDIKDASSAVFHNHVPLDSLADVVRLEKRVDRRTASVGDPVTYTITVHNRSSRNLTAAESAPVRILDRPAPGLRILTDAAHVQLYTEDPTKGTRQRVLGWKGVTATGRLSTFGDFDLPAGGKVLLVYQAVVGLDAREGSHENDAVLVGPGDVEVSNHDRALVRVVNDPEFDQGYLVGRVFCDGNGDGEFDTAGKSKDRADRPIMGAKVYIDTGWWAGSDLDGKFHLKDVPPGVHLVKLDPDTVPPGSTVVGEPSRVIFFTRGLPAKVSFPVKCEGQTVGPQSVELAKEPAKRKPFTLRVEGNVRTFQLGVGGNPIDPGDVDLAVISGAPGTPPPPTEFEQAVAPSLPPPDAQGVPVHFHFQSDLKAARGWVLRVERIDEAGGPREPVYTLRTPGAPPDKLDWDGREGGEAVLLTGGLYAAKLVVASESGLVSESPWRRFGVGYGMAGVAAEEESASRRGMAEILRGDLFRGQRPTPELSRKIVASAKKLPKAPGYVVEVHTDEGATPDAAKNLSQAQADAVKALIGKALGVSPDAVKAVGWGRARPVVPNTTPGNRKKNRRVVLRVEKGSEPAQPAAAMPPGIDLPPLPPEDERVFVGPLAARLAADGRFAEDVEPPASGQLAIDMQRADGRRAALMVAVAAGARAGAPPPPVGGFARKVRVRGDLKTRMLAVDGQTLPIRLLDADLSYADGAPDFRVEPGGAGKARLITPVTLALSAPDGDGSRKLRRWSVQVRREDGAVIYRTGGDGAPPPAWSWRGEDDAGSALLTIGGDFFFRLTVEDDAGDRGQSAEVRLPAGEAPPASVEPLRIDVEAPTLFGAKGEAFPAVGKALGKLKTESKARPSGTTYRFEIALRGSGPVIQQRARQASAASAVRQVVAQSGLPADAYSVEAHEALPAAKTETLRIVAQSPPPKFPDGPRLPPQVMAGGQTVPTDAQGVFDGLVSIEPDAPVVVDVQDERGHRAIVVATPSRLDSGLIEAGDLDVRPLPPPKGVNPDQLLKPDDILPPDERPGRKAAPPGVGPPDAGPPADAAPPPDAGMPDAAAAPRPDAASPPDAPPKPAFKRAPPAAGFIPAPEVRAGAYTLAAGATPMFALAQAKPADTVGADLDKALSLPGEADKAKRKKPVRAADLAVTLPPRGLVLRSERLEVRGRTDPANEIRVNGRPVPVERDGRFVTLCLLPFGPSNVEVKAKDPAGNVATIVWPVEVSESQLFVMALGDGAIASARANGRWTADGAAQDGMTSATTTTTGALVLHGRGAVYLKGRMQGNELFRHISYTGHVDTAKQSELEAFYEQVVDPNRYYPVYGDSAEEVRDAKSRGKVYVLVEADESRLRVGNFRSGIKGIELLSFDRAVYGAEVDFKKGWDKDRVRAEARGFASKDDAHLVRDHNVLRATGGSIYYLRHGQLVPGGERVRMVVRDRTSGLVLVDRTLARDTDYVIDYFGGRLVTKAPVPSIADPAALTNPAASFSPGGGHPVYIEVDYDYESDGAVTGATYGGLVRGKLGMLTVGGGVAEEGRIAGATDYRVFGVFTELRPASHTALRGEFARSQSFDARNFLSEDGGLTYLAMNQTSLQATDGRAGDRNAWKVDFESDLAAALGNKPGGFLTRAYLGKTDRGFFSNGSILEQGRTKFGGELAWKVSKLDKLVLRHDGVFALLPALGNPAVNPREDPLVYRRVETETMLLKYAREFSGGGGFDLQYQYQYQDGYGAAIADRATTTNRHFATAGFRIKQSEKVTWRLGQEALLYASGGDPQYELKDLPSGGVAPSKHLSDRFTSQAGFDVKLAPGLTLSATEAVRWSGSNATLFGLRSQMSPTASWYVRERFEDRNGQTIATSIVGAEDKLQGTQNGRAYGEYQLDGGSSGERNRAIMGITNKWRVSPGLSLNGNLEHQQIFGARLPDGTPLGNQSRSIVGIGHEVLRERRLKLGGRLELRFDNSDGAVTPGQVPGAAGYSAPNVDAARSQPGDPAYADRTALPGSQGILSPGDKVQILVQQTAEAIVSRGLTLFGRVNWSRTQNRSLCNEPGGASFPAGGQPATCKSGRAIEARFLEATAGAAWRPAESDRVSMLGRYSFILDSRPLGLTGGLAHDKSAHVFALSPIFELPFHLQLVEKLAWKRETSRFAVTPTDGLETRTDAFLWINRLNLHLIGALDLGAEFRRLRLVLPAGAEQAKWGTLVEIGFWLNPYTRLGAGWNFSHFSDNELQDLDRDTHGFFIRVVGRY